MKRPFLTLLIFIIINLFLCLNISFGFVLILNVFLSLVFIVLKDRKIIIFIIISMIMSLIMSNIVMSNVEVFENRLIIEGNVREYEIGNNEKFILKTNNIILYGNNNKFKTKILVTYDGDIKDLIGKNIVINSQINIPFTNTNPKMFSYRNYLSSKGIRYISYIDKSDIIQIEENKFNFAKIIFNSRKVLSNKFEEIYSGKTLSFIKGFIYGDKSDFINEDLDKFYEVGLGHILVVSGLHFGMIYLILSKILSQLQIDITKRVVIISVVLFIMLAITGFKISAIRAFIMIIIIESIYLIDRRVDILNLISFIAIIVIILNPFSIYSLSFILSFGAIFSISLFYDKISDKIPKVLRLILSVQIILLLISIYTFNRVNISTLLINIPTNFIVGILYILIIVNFFLYKLEFLTIIISKIIELIFIMVDFFNEIEIFKFTIRSFNFIEFFIILIIFLLIIYKKENKIVKNIHIVYFLIVSIIILNTATLLNEDLFINFYDVSSGDCSLVITPHKSKILIDTGRPDNYHLIGDILLKNGIRDIDIVVLTHNHTDHIGGMKNLMKNHQIKYLILSKESEKNANMKYICNQLDDSTKIILCENGDEITIDGLKFSILNPVGESELNENNQSVVLDLRYNNRSILFTGDIEKETEENILKLVKKDYDILKVCHHGSETSSTKVFIDRVNPDYSIIQVGKNSYGHPSDVILKTLEKSKTKIYRNDIDGCIMVRINDKIEVHSMESE